MRLVPNVPPDGGSTDWTDLLDDPRTVHAIFGEAPSLDQVELLSITLRRDGPVAAVSIELAESEFPVFPPSKWRDAGFNRVHVELQCVGVSALEIRGLETTPIFDLKIEQDGRLIRVHGATVEMSVDIGADCLVVANTGVSAYLRDDEWGWF
jgi:hypothetical protein